MADLLVKSSAVLSDDGRYRYSLRREWGVGPYPVFVMLNPSTADADTDDPTIRRCMGFARSWGGGGIVVVNLFALRATDPAELERADDPFGPLNIEHFNEETRDRDIIIGAWGAHPMAKSGVAMLGPLVGRIKECLGTTQDGSPRHPLYLPKTAARVPWAAYREAGE